MVREALRPREAGGEGKDRWSAWLQSALPRAGPPEAGDLPYWAGGPCESASLRSRGQEQLQKGVQLGMVCGWMSPHKLYSR